MKKYIYNSGNKSQKLLILIYIFFSASFYPLSGGEPIILSSDLKSYIEKIEYDLLGVSKGVNEITVIDKNIIHVRIFFILDKQIQQDDWQVVVTPAFNPEYHWAPHLTPTDSHVIEQHVFRSPALIASDRNSMLMLIPDLDIMKRGTPVRWYMDLDAPGNRLVIGMSNSRVDNHILFTREPGAIYPKGEVEFGFYIIHSDDENALNNPFRLALNFLWTNWGHDLYQSGNPVDGDLEKYVEHPLLPTLQYLLLLVYASFQISVHGQVQRKLSICPLPVPAINDFHLQIHSCVHQQYLNQRTCNLQIRDYSLPVH
jgi:hypothetical protein